MFVPERTKHCTPLTSFLRCTSGHTRRVRASCLDVSSKGAPCRVNFKRETIARYFVQDRWAPPQSQPFCCFRARIGLPPELANVICFRSATLGSPPEVFVEERSFALLARQPRAQVQRIFDSTRGAVFLARTSSPFQRFLFGGLSSTVLSSVASYLFTTYRLGPTSTATLLGIRIVCSGMSLKELAILAPPTTH